MLALWFLLLVLENNPVSQCKMIYIITDQTNQLLPSQAKGHEMCLLTIVCKASVTCRGMLLSSA